MDKDIANSDPAEGARDVIERELKRSPAKQEEKAEPGSGDDDAPTHTSRGARSG